MCDATTPDDIGPSHALFVNSSLLTMNWARAWTTSSRERAITRLLEVRAGEVPRSARIIDHGYDKSGATSDHVQAGGRPPYPPRRQAAVEIAQPWSDTGSIDASPASRVPEAGVCQHAGPRQCRHRGPCGHHRKRVSCCVASRSRSPGLCPVPGIPRSSLLRPCNATKPCIMRTPVRQWDQTQVEVLCLKHPAEMGVSGA